MALQINSTEVLGARLLREVAAEEGSLEDVRLKKSLSIRPPKLTLFSIAPQGPLYTLKPRPSLANRHPSPG
jgi:hypothetical protein